MDHARLTIDQVAASLDWPEAAALLNPSGGAAVLAELAHDKIGRGLSPLIAPDAYRLGILSSAPEAESTQAPLAIVLEFGFAVSVEILREAKRLSWNFSHSPALIAIEPDLVRVWTCCETPPPPDQPITVLEVHAVSAGC